LLLAKNELHYDISLTKGSRQSGWIEAFTTGDVVSLCLNWNESFAWPADRILCTLVGACVPYLEETFCCVLGGRTYRGVPYLEETFCCALSLARGEGRQ
jgi:hypothetical protein